jgi:predicted nucleic acid-binding protein
MAAREFSNRAKELSWPNPNVQSEAPRRVNLRIGLPDVRDSEEFAQRSSHGLARRNDAELALPTVTIAEIAFGIQKIRPDQRAERLELGLSDWRRRFADRIFGLTEEAALVYGEIMGMASRRGRAMSAPVGLHTSMAVGWQRATSAVSVQPVSG